MIKVLVRKLHSYLSLLRFRVLSSDTWVEAGENLRLDGDHFLSNCSQHFIYCSSYNCALLAWPLKTSLKVLDTFSLENFVVLFYTHFLFILFFLMKRHFIKFLRM